MKTVLVWFKTDLRLQDNEALVRAIAESDQIIPVYCFDNSHYETTEYGFKKTGSFRAQFLLESLQDLDKSLRSLGSGLLVLNGKPEIEISKLAQKYQAKKVFAKREVAPEEIQTDQSVQKELGKFQCEMQNFDTSTLFHAQDLPFLIKDIPDVYTGFRKKVEQQSAVRSTFERPEKINSPELPPMELPSLTSLGLSVAIADPRAAIHFIGGEAAAIARLNYYFFETQAISNYKETRNGMVGSDYSSKFSAWLALGCISSKYIYHRLKEYEVTFGANDSTYWMAFELLWRDYFRFMMEKYQHGFFKQFGIQNKRAALHRHHADQLQCWIDGKTGIDFIDANMREMQLTGFMSNRGRQNVASYLCNDLKLDWRYGAAYFEQQLIDYDVSSNWGNWAYLAGVGNDPRGNRYFNIEKQANMYDQNRLFRSLWL